MSICHIYMAFLLYSNNFDEIYEEVKPLWTLLSCLIKLLLSEKADKHLSHLYGFFPIVEQL